MHYSQKLCEIERFAKLDYWPKRIYSELLCLGSISKVNGNEWDNRIEQALDFLLSDVQQNKTVTMPAVLKTEEMLADLSLEVKK